jgi:phospholipid/cholesterol/gamma-HCH transport system permease protein
MPVAPTMPSATVVRDGDAVRLAGRLTVSRAAALERDLAAAIGADPGPFRIDLSAVDRIDTVGAWLVHKLVRDAPGSRVEAASPEARNLIAEVAAGDAACTIRPAQPPFLLRELERLGLYVFELFRTAGAGLAFIGMTLSGAVRAVSQGRGIRWGAVSVQMEQTGVSALGIVGLMSFLIGIVLAQQGAVQLASFGAEVFTINLVGRATFRELGILLTAIMVAGRSASAFAAQIGSMKIAEEVDAMRTIGLDPVEVLVLPRVIGLTLVMPLLAFYASILAVMGGGLFCWLSLDIPPATFVQRIREVVPMSDFWIGLSKAPVFGAIIAIIGCFQGFQVAGNAESLGMRTTLAVVQAIFIVIVLDAFFAVFYTALGFV